MNEQLTLQSTQHEETKTVPLRRRKACLAGTFALFAACALVLLIPHSFQSVIIILTFQSRLDKRTDTIKGARFLRCC